VAKEHRTNPCVNEEPSWEFTSSDWTTVAEFEAILNCTKITSTLAQIEKYYMAAYTILIKGMAMSKLKAPTLAVVEMSKVTESPNVPRANVMIDNLSELAMLLDKRTLGCHHVSAEQRSVAVGIFCREYVKYAKTAELRRVRLQPHQI